MALYTGIPTRVRHKQRKAANGFFQAKNSSHSRYFIPQSIRIEYFKQTSISDVIPSITIGTCVISY